MLPVKTSKPNPPLNLYCRSVQFSVWMCTHAQSEGKKRYTRVKHIQTWGYFAVPCAPDRNAFGKWEETGAPGWNTMQTQEKYIYKRHHRHRHSFFTGSPITMVPYIRTLKTILLNQSHCSTWGSPSVRTNQPTYIRQGDADLRNTFVTYKVLLLHLLAERAITRHNNENAQNVEENIIYTTWGLFLVVLAIRKSGLQSELRLILLNKSSVTLGFIMDFLLKAAH